MPLRILKDRNGLFVALINFTVSFVSFSVCPTFCPAIVLLSSARPALSLLTPLSSSWQILYFYPQFFEIVKQKSASEAGAHLLPNSIALSVGSLFAGWVRSILRTIVCAARSRSGLNPTGHPPHRALLLAHRRDLWPACRGAHVLHLPHRVERLVPHLVRHLAERLRLCQRHYRRSEYAVLRLSPREATPP